MNRLSVFSLLALLGACSSYQTAQPIQLDYSQMGRIGFNVRGIEVADNSAASPGAMQPTVSDAIRRWAADRLQASGASGQATLVIKDASFKSEPLHMETGMNSWFKRQQANKLTAHAEVQLDARNGSDYASATAEASRSVTVPEDPQPAEKQEAYKKLLDGLMSDLNQYFEQSVHEHMQRFTGADSGSIPVPR